MKTNQSNSNKKLFLIISLVFLAIFLVISAVYLISKSNLRSVDQQKDGSSVNEVPNSNIIIKDDSFVFAAMGDMLAHDTIIANAKTNGDYDFTKFFSNIRKSYSDADVVFCNQEGLSSGEKYGISGYPSFNAPKEFSVGLKNGAGCNLINLANNHIGDKGINAINDTIDGWNALNPLAVSGANKSVDDQNKVSYATVNNITIGFVAFADFNNNRNTPAYAVNIYHNNDLFKKLITEARQNSDIVVVSMHWGTEDSNVVNNDQNTQINTLASFGVDVVIGTGPHVIQKYDVINRPDGKEMHVWYSLGNMLSSQLNINQLIGGIAKFKVTKKDNSIFISENQFIPTYMHYEWTATESANYDLLARKNAMIYLLKDAAEPLSGSLFNTSVDGQMYYVKNVMGGEVKVIE